MAEVPDSIEACIETALIEVQTLVREAFSKVADVAPSGSALDQAGLIDGDEIVRDYILHGECGSALHHLIYMAYELDLPISKHTYNCIERAGRAMRMESNKWSRLRHGD